MQQLQWIDIAEKNVVSIAMGVPQNEWFISWKIQHKMDENGRYPHDLGNLHFSVLESSNQMIQRSQPRTLSNEW